MLAENAFPVVRESRRRMLFAPEDSFWKAAPLALGQSLSS